MYKVYFYKLSWDETDDVIITQFYIITYNKSKHIFVM